MTKPILTTSLTDEITGHKLPFSVVANSGGQKQKKAPGRRLVTKLGRICEEEEEEGKRENYRQKLVIGGRSSEEMTDGSEGKGKSGKLAEKTAFWDGWAHRERQIGQMADSGKGGQNWTTDRAEKIFKFF